MSERIELTVKETIGKFPQGSVDITQNGSHDVTDFAEANVNVPNSYSASDEGKVVDGGALVEQTSKAINTNGTHDTTTNNSVTVDVPNSYTQDDEGKVVNEGALVEQTTKAITENGTHDTTLNDEVTVDVPNTYTAADEGKVVDGGALVSQTSLSVTENDTYDTTTKNEVVVNVPNPSTGTLSIEANGTYDVTEYAEAEVNVPLPSGSISIEQNGQHDVTNYETANVNVPNTYTAQDEGKVVESGALVSQDGLDVTANGTYNTTKKNQVVVDVPTGDEWEKVLLWENPDPTQSMSVDTQLPLSTSDGGYEYLELRVTIPSGTAIHSYIRPTNTAQWPVFIGTSKCSRGFGFVKPEGADWYIKINTDAYQIGNSNVVTVYTDRIIPVSVHGLRKNRTVLYSDGTFIINEKILDSENNERLHGAASYTYPPLNAYNDYVFPESGTALWNDEMALISSVEFGDEISPTSLAYWFDHATNLENIDWSNFDGSNVTSARSLFVWTAFTSIMLPPMPNLENVDYAFGNCPNLRMVDLSQVGTTKINSMKSTFGGSPNLEVADISGISGTVTDGTTTFANKFGSSVPMALTTIYANPNLDFSSTTVSNTFRRCDNLVGGAGTTWASNRASSQYARIDNPPNAPGYFTLKE